MANVLIIYATQQGQTAKIARHMAQALSGAHVVELSEANEFRAELDPERFGLVVIAAPVHLGSYPASVVRFARRNRAALERVSTVFLSVGLAILSRTSDGRSETLKIVERFIKTTGFRPRRVELIAGALPYSKYNFLTRFMMKLITAREGGDTDTSRDYEYTDWPALSRLARDIAAPLEGINDPRFASLASSV